MGLLMKRKSVMRCFGLVGVAALMLCGASVSLGGGIDPALQAKIMKMFPKASACRNLSEDSRSSLTYHVLEMRNEKALVGHCVVLQVVSRSGPFNIWVAIAPDETVMEVKVPDYPHIRGRAVRKKSFLDQFKGVAYGKPLTLGEQVDGVSGATISATAITGGVRQALVLVHRAAGRK